MFDCFLEACVFSKRNISSLALCQRCVVWSGGLGEAPGFVATFGLAANTSPKLTFIPRHTFEGETAKLFSI